MFEFDSTISFRGVDVENHINLSKIVGLINRIAIQIIIFPEMLLKMFVFQ